MGFFNETNTDGKLNDAYYNGIVLQGSGHICHLRLSSRELLTDLWLAEIPRHWQLNSSLSSQFWDGKVGVLILTRESAVLNHAKLSRII